MSVTARKRVSFGSHKSMVLIIDIDDGLISDEERTFYRRNRVHLRPSQSSTDAELSSASILTSSSSTETKHTRSGSEDTVETQNPFSAHGELSQKADYILRHSRISRNDLHIVDPDSYSFHAEKVDLSKDKVSRQDKAKETMEYVSEKLEKTRVQSVALESKTTNSDTADNDSGDRIIVPKAEKISKPEKLQYLNHDLQRETKDSAKSVTASVINYSKCSPISAVCSVNAVTTPQYQRAEQVKLPNRTRKCCNVQ